MRIGKISWLVICFCLSLAFAWNECVPREMSQVQAGISTGGGCACRGLTATACSEAGTGNENCDSTFKVCHNNPEGEAECVSAGGTPSCITVPNCTSSANNDKCE